jgi:hypothetical protein
LAHLSSTSRAFGAGLLLLTATTFYAFLRYHVYGTAPREWFALWTMNKAVSWTAAGMLALAYLVRDRNAARLYGLVGFVLMLGHVAVSFALLDSRRYAKLFAGDDLTTLAWVSMIAGGFGGLALCLPARASRAAAKAELGDARWSLWQRAGYIGLAMTAVHCAAIGVPGWLEPSKWQGGMPPITLWGCLFAVAPLVRRAVPRRGQPIGQTARIQPDQ